MQELKDYKLLDNWGMSKELAIKLMGLGTIAMFVFSWLFSSVYLWLTGGSSIQIEITDNPILSAVFIIALIFVTGSVHELLHGFFFKKYGAMPVYGAGFAYHFFPYFYTTTKERFFFTRRPFIISLLAPLVCISSIGIILMLILPSISQWFLLPLVFNEQELLAIFG
jgi:hypothetical protein